MGLGSSVTCPLVCPSAAPFVTGFVPIAMMILQCMSSSLTLLLNLSSKQIVAAITQYFNEAVYFYDKHRVENSNSYTVFYLRHRGKRLHPQFSYRGELTIPEQCIHISFSMEIKRENGDRLAISRVPMCANSPLVEFCCYLDDSEERRYGNRTEM